MENIELTRRSRKFKDVPRCQHCGKATGSVYCNQRSCPANIVDFSFDTSSDEFKTILSELGVRPSYKE